MHAYSIHRYVWVVISRCWNRKKPVYWSWVTNLIDCDCTVDMLTSSTHVHSSWINIHVQYIHMYIHTVAYMHTYCKSGKLLENVLGIAGRPATFSQQVVWAPEVPPGPLLLSKNEPPQLTPGTHSQLGGLVGVVGGREKKTTQWWDLNP